MVLDQSLSDEMAQSIGLIRKTFVEGLPDKIDFLDQAVTHVELGHEVDYALTAAGQELHRIAGVAKTLGFPALGELAREAEEQINLARLKPHDEEAIAAVIDKIDIAVTAMVDIMDAENG